LAHESAREIVLSHAAQSRVWIAGHELPLFWIPFKIPNLFYL